MRSCLMVFLIFIVILTMPTFFTVINIGTILTPAFIKQELVKSGTISEVSKKLPGELAKSFDSSGNINSAAIKSYVAQIPEPTIASALQSNIDSNLSALTDPKSKQLVFDLSQIMKTLPPEAVAQMQQESKGQIKDGKLIYPIPAQIRIYRFVVNNLTLSKVVGAVIYLILLLLILLLADGWKAKLRAVSLTLLIPGILILIPFFIFKYWPIALPDMSSVPSYISFLATDLFKVLKNDFAGMFIWEGFILIFLSIATFVISFLVESSPKPAPNPSAVKSAPKSA